MLGREKKRNGEGEDPNEHYRLRLLLLLQTCSCRESRTHVSLWSLLLLSSQGEKGERTSLILELIS